jgi:predicted MFS family arabinose efflux permease
MPIGVIAVLVVLFRLHLNVPTHRHQIDYLGAALLTAGVSALILVTTWGGNEYGWGSPTIVALAAVGVVLLAIFLRVETRAAEPIIPLKLFRSRVFSVASSIGFAIGLAMFGAIIFIPLFLQLVYGVSPTSSGLRMLPLMAGLLTASVLSGRAISRMGRYKVFPVVGTAVTTVGLFLLSRLQVDTAPWLASVYMLVLGVGIGLVMQVIVLVVQNDAPPRDIGVATSTATFFRSMGGSLGVALFGAIFASRLTSELMTLPGNAGAQFSGGINVSPDQVPRAGPRDPARLPARVRQRAAARVPGGRRRHPRRVRARVVPQGGSAARRHPRAGGRDPIGHRPEPRDRVRRRADRTNVRIAQDTIRARVPLTQISLIMSDSELAS